MAIDALQTLDVIETMENFIEKIRPPEHIRPKLDMGYKIEEQSIFLFEIRPDHYKPEIIREYHFAKVTFVKAKNHWKIFWMKSDLNWHSYTPNPTVVALSESLEIIEEDKYHCFWG